jgi:hypothetical protein
MTAQIAVFQPRGIEGNVHVPQSGMVTRTLRIHCDTDLTIHLDYDFDPAKALSQIDRLIEGLHDARHRVAGTTRTEALTAEPCVCTVPGPMPDVDCPVHR